MPQTLRLGSTGPDVVKWQNVLRAAGVGARVTPDGKFGPLTEQATLDYQRAHKLVPDGVVGRASWAMAGESDGLDVGQQMQAEQTAAAAEHAVTSLPSTSNADAAAYKVATNAAPVLGLTEPELQYALAVSRGETFYSKSWGSPSDTTRKLSAKFGLRGDEGAGSNNWGAEQGQGDAGAFQHVDVHANGSPYVAPYQRHSTPELGFARFAKTLYSGNKRGAAGAKELRDAVARGSLADAVKAQHSNGYFELAPDKYLTAVLHNYAALAQNTGWVSALTERGFGSGSPSGAAGVGALAALGLGLLGALVWRLRA